VIGRGVVKFPPTEGLVKLLLVVPQDRDVDILVGTRFAPHPEIQRPTPRYPPGRIEAAHEARKPGRIEVLPLPMVGVVQADHNKH
jgi:hypothetical protein